MAQDASYAATADGASSRDITTSCAIVGAGPAGLMLGLYAVCVFPVNIKHALSGGTVFGLSDPWLYHGPRLLLQPVLVWWAFYAGGVTDWPFRRETEPR